MVRVQCDGGRVPMPASRGSRGVLGNYRFLRHGALLSAAPSTVSYVVTQVGPRSILRAQPRHAIHVECSTPRSTSRTREQSPDRRRGGQARVVPMYL